MMGRKFFSHVKPPNTLDRSLSLVIYIEKELIEVLLFAWR